MNLAKFCKMFRMAHNDNKCFKIFKSVKDTIKKKSILLILKNFVSLKKVNRHIISLTKKASNSI